MTGFEYQALAMRTRNDGLSDKDTLLNAVCGLNGEAGECIDLVKKHYFQGHDLNEDELVDELGDVLWYAALLCEAMGTCLDRVMLHNVEKLKARYPEGFDADHSVNRTI